MYASYTQYTRPGSILQYQKSTTSNIEIVIRQQINMQINTAISQHRWHVIVLFYFLLYSFVEPKHYWIIPAWKHQLFQKYLKIPSFCINVRIIKTWHIFFKYLNNFLIIIKFVFIIYLKDKTSIIFYSIINSRFK